MFRFLASLCVLAILAAPSFASGIGVGFGLQRATFASPFYGARLFSPFVPSVVVQQQVYAQPIVQQQVLAAPVYQQAFAQQAFAQPVFAQASYAQFATVGSSFAIGHSFQRQFVPRGPTVIRSRTVIRR